jgi:SAM-dependent methyltransferase
VAEGTRFQSIAHRNRRYGGPVSAARAAAIAAALKLSADAIALDAGCGKGGLLLAVLARYGCRGLGLESDPDAVAAAREFAVDDGLAGCVDFIARSPATFTPQKRLDAVLCLEPARAFGDLDAAARRCFGWLRTGGRLVIGSRFLRRTPQLEFRSSLQSHDAPIEAYGESARAMVNGGFELLATMVLGEGEWDEYVGAQHRALLSFAEQHPEDPDAVALRERAESAYQVYWRHGRDTIGFAIHILRKPRSGSLHVVS